MTIQFPTYQIHILSDQNIKFDVDCSQFPIFQHNQQTLATWGGGGGGTPFYKPFRYVLPKGLGLFGLNCPFWSGIGYGFRGN